MITVLIENDLDKVEEMNLGEITVSEIPAIKKALIGQMVYANGGRRIYTSILHCHGGSLALSFQYGDEL